MGPTVETRQRQREYFLRQAETRKLSSDIRPHCPSQWALWALTRLLLSSCCLSCSVQLRRMLTPTPTLLQALQSSVPLGSQSLFFLQGPKCTAGKILDLESSSVLPFFSLPFISSLLSILFHFLKTGLFTCLVSQLSVANRVCDKDRLDEGVP